MWLIYRNARRLLKLVNALLEFSRIEAGRVSATYELTDLASYTAELASAFESATERVGLGLIVRSELQRGPVAVDRGMWERVVMNLLSNAFKFTLEGSISVVLDEDPERNAVRLRVTDTGIGIRKDDLEHLFERFHRVQNAGGRSFEGTGIGLALVRELVTLHGGAIKVESEFGRGTVFTVIVPRTERPTNRTPEIEPVVGLSAAAADYVEEAVGWIPDEDLPMSAPKHIHHLQPVLTR